MTTHRPDLAAALAQVEKWHRDQVFGDDVYYQCLVTLAGTHLCQHHDAESALILLNRIPPQYFQTTIVTQMEADGVYAASVVEMSHRMMQLGLVDISPQDPNQPPAEA